MTNIALTWYNETKVVVSLATLAAVADSRPELDFLAYVPDPRDESRLMVVGARNLCYLLTEVRTGKAEVDGYSVYRDWNGRPTYLGRCNNSVFIFPEPPRQP